MHFLISVLLLVLAFSVTNGYYVREAHERADNSRGFLNQTSWSLSREKEAKKEKNNPDKNKQNHVPQFMLDLYEHLADKRWSPKFDTARSYSAINSDAVITEKLHSRYYMTEVRRLWFNISHFPSTEYLQLAQLRLYVEPIHIESQIDSDDTIMLTVLSFSRTGNKELISSPRFLDSSDGYWETFNVTMEVAQWLAKESPKEQKLEIQIQKPNIQDSSVFEIVLDPTDEDKAPQILLLSKNSISSRSDNHHLVRTKRNLHQDVMNASIAESTLKRLPESFHPSPNGTEHAYLLKDELRHLIVKRSDDEELEEMEEQSNYIGEEVGKSKKGKSRRRKNPCRRKPMHVNFAAINYDQWIIAPPSYEAFECTGRCWFPMSAHLTPTNHAIIKTLMHSLHPKQVTRACCVPTKLDPISVLYVDDDGTVTYRYEYKDMVVTECGCR